MTTPKWPERLVIVRHGQSEQNLALDLLDDNLEETLHRLQKTRDADIAVTETGIWQAEQTGLYLGTTEPFDICFSSPYKRTLQTTEGIISQFPYKLQYYEDERLREKEFGRLHGLTAKDIREQYPEEFKDRERDGKYWYRLLRGENYPDVNDRVHRFQDKLVRDWSGKSVLVVTHQIPYLSFRTLFEHLNEGQVLALGDVPNCGIQEYRLDTSKYPEGRMKLEEWNKVVYETRK